MQILATFFIPSLIALMMLVVGLALTLDDFRRVQQFPGIVFIGALGQLFLLPCITIIIVWLLKPPPLIVEGMILVAASPGGAISNYYVYMARADVALSTTLTAISTLTGLVTVPLVVSLGFWMLLNQHQQIIVSPALMVKQLISLILLPIILGMCVRHFWSDWAARRSVALRNLSFLSLALIIAFVILEQTDKLLLHIKDLALSASAYTLLTMMAGWGVGIACRVNRASRFTFMVEFSVRNLAAVIVVGASMLNDSELVVFAAAFFLIQVPFMLFAVHHFRRLNRLLPVSAP